jgi:hypothetical protein
MGSKLNTIKYVTSPATIAATTGLRIPGQVALISGILHSDFMVMNQNPCQNAGDWIDTYYTESQGQEENADQSQVSDIFTQYSRLTTLHHSACTEKLIEISNYKWSYKGLVAYPIA